MESQIRTLTSNLHKCEDALEAQQSENENLKVKASRLEGSRMDGLTLTQLVELENILATLFFSPVFHYSLFIIHYPLSIIHYPLSIIHYPLSIIHYPLSIIHYPLSIIHYPLSIIHYPLSIIHYPLSIIHYLFNIFFLIRSDICIMRGYVV